MLRDRPIRDDMTKRGYVSLLSNYGDVKANKQTTRAARRELNRLVAHRRDWFSTDVDLWGQVGYAMLTLEMAEECAAWLRNWRDFPAAQPWMVNNLVIAQLKTDDRAGARANVQDLLRQPFYNDTVMRCHLLEAVWLHLDGKREDALRHQALVNPALLDRTFETPLQDFADWLARFSDAPKGTVPLATHERDDWKRLKHTFANFRTLSRDLDRAKAMRAKAAGKRLWAWDLARLDLPASRETQKSNNFIFIYWIAVVVLLQIVRACSNVKGL